MAETLEVKAAKERLRLAGERLESAARPMFVVAIGSGAVMSLLAKRTFRRAVIHGIRWLLHRVVRGRQG